MGRQSRFCKWQWSGTPDHSQVRFLAFRKLRRSKVRPPRRETNVNQKDEKLLTQALLQDVEMNHSLYEFELEEIVDDLKQSMRDDNDDYIFSVTENSGHVAMVLIEESGQLYEQAREKLKPFGLRHTRATCKN